MSRSTFTEAARARLVARIELGASLADAALASGVRPDTARSWLKRGRAEDAGPYASFAAAVDKARAAARPGRGSVPDEREVLELLSRAARAGSVPALRELLRWHRERRRPLADGHPLDELDELARRRGDRR